MVDAAFFLLARSFSGSELLGRSESFLRAVIRVLTTHMGFVMRTVALPAIAPAIIDSIVVSFLDARPAFNAARSKPARVHSYPATQVSLNFHTQLDGLGKLTVIVNKIGDTYAEECGI